MIRLLNKVAIVTGANSGMGMATARALLDEGATVIMLCRSEKRGKEAYKKLLEDGNSRTYLILCDLGDYESIRSFVRQVRERFGRLDILVNNAGFISLDRQETKEGLERQFGINHVGHFLLTTELLDIMGEGARIVNVASGAHKTGNIHFEVGSKVRQTIADLGGTMPEELPTPKKSIKQIEKESVKRFKLNEE